MSRNAHRTELNISEGEKRLLKNLLQTPQFWVGPGQLENVSFFIVDFFSYDSYFRCFDASR